MHFKGQGMIRAIFATFSDILKLVAGLIVALK
jgi:hypothetical protein